MAEGQPATDNFTQWMTVAVMAMTLLALLVIFIFRLAISRVMKEREKMRQAELEHQQKLLYNSITIQERERQRIATNLHDELSSRLLVLKLNLHQLERDGPHLPDPVKTLLDETLRLSRNIAHELYPPMLAELGLAETIRDYLTPLQGEIQTTLYIAQSDIEPPNEVSLQLFRTIQELIQNTLKHAQASHLFLQLRVTSRCSVLRLRDNGKGYIVKEARGGLGLTNIESRVQLVNGRYRINSTPRKGTSTLILIPHGND